MNTWFLWPLLVGTIVLATDVSPSVDHVSPTIDRVKPTHEIPLDHPPSTRGPHEEVVVSFARGRPQKIRESIPEAETHTENVLNHSSVVSRRRNVSDTFPVKPKASEKQSRRNVSETLTVKPKVKALPAKIRRKRPHGSHRRVFADRVFGKKYGQASPKVVINKLKHDLLNNFTQEVANVSENGGEDERSGRKRKMEFDEWKGVAVERGGLASGEKRKRDLNVWKNLVSNREKKYIQKMAAAPDAAPEVVNETESGANSTESDLEPPKKALLTYRQFVEKKLSKLSRGFNLESFTEAGNVEEGSGKAGDLLDDHESAPLDENVLSVMAVP